MKKLFACKEKVFSSKQVVSLPDNEADMRHHVGAYRFFQGYKNGF